MLGASNITSLGENSAAARALTNAYDPVLKDLLSKHYWKFATKRVELSLSIDTPVFEYSYQFALPGDYLTIIRIEPADRIYSVEDGFLLCDENSVAIKYIFLNTDATTYSGSFCECLAILLAARINFKITQNNSRDAELRDNFKTEFKMAKSMDAKQGTPQKFRDDLWIAARGNTDRPPEVIIDGNVDYGNFDYGQ